MKSVSRGRPRVGCPSGPKASSGGIVIDPAPADLHAGEALDEAREARRVLGRAATRCGLTAVPRVLRARPRCRRGWRSGGGGPCRRLSAVGAGAFDEVDGGRLLGTLGRLDLVLQLLRGRAG